MELNGNSPRSPTRLMKILFRLTPSYDNGKLKSSFKGLFFLYFKIVAKKRAYPSIAY